MLTKLVQHTDSSRFTHLVISLTTEGVFGNSLREAGAEVKALGMKRGRPSVKAAVRGLMMLRKWRPDLLQTWLYHADLLGVAGRSVCGSPLLWNIRCSEHDGLRSLTTRLCALLSRVPDVVIVNSVAGRRTHEGIGYHPARWEPIPNGFDTRRFKPDQSARRDVRCELAVGPDALLVGLVARVDPLKDHRTFFRAASRLASRDPRVHFVLIGDGTDALDVSKDVDAAPAAARFRLLGRRNDVPRLMAALDVATSCSSAEGFPNVIGEAMACGVPCVVTDAGDSEPIVGATGVVVPRCDPEALANAWARVLALSAADREALGAAARQRIQDRFRLEVIVNRYQQLWSELAAGSKGSSAAADTPEAIKCVG